jgi:rhodanese-related sulfurtransferase
MEINDLIRMYYEIENATVISPHSLRKRIKERESNFILVDLRSCVEYQSGHISGAINIPVYKDPNTPAYEEKERIVSEFKKIVDQNSGNEIIVYCYSKYCMSGKKVGKMLSEKQIFVKHLALGWNEWRYHWNIWNHEHEWNETSVFDYVEGEIKGELFLKPNCDC